MVKTHSETPQPNDQSRDDSTDIVTVPSASSGDSSRYTGGDLSVDASSAQSCGPSEEAYKTRFDEVSRNYQGWIKEEERVDWLASAVRTALNRTDWYRRHTRISLMGSMMITADPSNPGATQENRSRVEEEMQSGKHDEMMLQMAVDDIAYGLLKGKIT
ncbi:hypothetical protein B9479_006851 [Cryptococcus floricola]|uniref:Uncharacterized protein n=1 Tax=Cryptococcus floricola TaxID=2591691 RepID=A0A5D3ALY2_9TREE|nr:hypothetical protein B9479_006851 [Cryptococcus floricola]